MGPIHQSLKRVSAVEPFINWTAINGDSYRFLRHEAEISLYYYRARYYNPNIGRFLQSDQTVTMVAANSANFFRLFRN
jgi:RHS repeat-associated protein